MNDYNMINEVWKDIYGYEGLYQISNHGRVYGVKRGNIKKSRFNKGYAYVNVSKKSVEKTLFVHRLVAQHFITNVEQKPEVNHKDEDTTNNHASNLMWCTSKENANWGTRKERIAKAMRERHNANGGSINPYRLRPYNLDLVPTIKVKNIN